MGLAFSFAFLFLLLFCAQAPLQMVSEAAADFQGGSMLNCYFPNGIRHSENVTDK